MSYHAATFRLLDSAPRTSAAAKAVVHDAEKRLGLSLPSSVREWYGCEDALAILAKHSNEDPPIAVPDFAVVEWQSRRLLPIRHENQGVCTWAIMLDGSEDPPVLVDVDSRGKDWRRSASTFSSYVYSCVWDYRRVFGQPAFVQAQNCSLSREALDGLIATHSEEMQTYGWPGSTQHRFSKGTAAILIWSSTGQADWFIASPDAATLESAVRAVCHLDDVGDYLCANSPIGEAVLDEIRSSTSGINHARDGR